MAGERDGAAALDAAIDDVMGDGQGDGNKGGGDAALEARARRMGWRPEGEYRGAKRDYLGAEEFIAKVETDMPVLRERLRFQGDTIGKLQSQLTDVTSMLKEMRDRGAQAEQRGFDARRREIEERMDRAAEEADKAAYQAAKRELAELEKMRPGASPGANGRDPAGNANGAGQQQNGGANSPEAQQWVNDNPWFMNSEPMRLYAIARDKELTQTRPSLSVRDRLALVREDVERRFSEVFENGERTKPPAVRTPGAPGSGNGAQRKPKEKTVADLPQEVQQTLAMLKRKDPKLTDEAYLKGFDWNALNADGTFK